MRSRQARPTRARAHPEFAAVALGALSSLYNFAYRLVGNEADAEDLVQDTYVEAFRHAGQLRNIARCRAWLFRILRNRRVSRERMRRAHPELIALEGGLEAADASMASEALPQLERAVVARLARPAILHALATLSEDIRTALLLCDLEAHGKRVSLFIADRARFPFPVAPGSRCTASLGDYHVCLLPAGETLLAMVGDGEQTAAMLGALEDAVGAWGRSELE